jgi:hypothetical protein
MTVTASRAFLLFIDGTHVSGKGSHVNWLFFSSSAALAAGRHRAHRLYFSHSNILMPGLRFQRDVFVAGIPELQQRVPDHVFQ